MTQNLKIDIIYYNTRSDFEFEFNLGGCCETRILSDSPSNRKDLLNSLSRAVSRSRVVFIVGDITGENNIIEITSKAISYPLCDVDKDLYNFDDKDCKILAGSLPLVSMNGSFGGCIIEKGTQSIILLTKEKSVRKSIMSHLVNSYITALSMTDGTDPIISDPTDLLGNANESIDMKPDEVLPESEEISDAQEDFSAEVLKAEEEITESSSISEDETDFAEKNESDDPGDIKESEDENSDEEPSENVDLYEAVITMQEHAEDEENDDLNEEMTVLSEELHIDDDDANDYASDEQEDANPDNINFHLDKNEEKYPNVIISNQVRKLRTVLFVLTIFLVFFVAFSLYLIVLITSKSDQGIFEYFKSVISTIFGR